VDLPQQMALVYLSFTTLLVHYLYMEGLMVVQHHSSEKVDYQHQMRLFPASTGVDATARYAAAIIAYSSRCELSVVDLSLHTSDLTQTVGPSTDILYSLRCIEGPSN